ncbi:MAG: proton-conducting transporter membrane subunit, partial [Oceanidesulfovibrio sp.]
GFLYIQTGSLNMLDLAGIIQNLGATPTIIAAFGLILSGILIKMAFFPAHGWLSNAYYHAGSPAAGLIAPMTTKVMVYIMVRMMLTVFSPHLVFDEGVLDDVLVIMASAAIVVCGLMALSTKNLTRMLTYILIAEVGYMVGGAWLGNRVGMTGAMLHVINDAAMTLTMFMAAGCLTHKLGRLDYSKLQGAFSRMPFTMGAFVLGAIAMIGVPPTCGFFSKWYLILGGLEAGHIEFVVALILSSLMNVVLFFRIFEIGFFEPWPEGTDSHGHPHRPAIAMREAPASMVGPLMVSAVALIVLGLLNSKLVAIIDNALPASLY